MNAPSVPARCFAHPAVPASTSCVACRRHLCDLCAFGTATGSRCPDCATSPQAERPRLGAAVTGVVLGALGAALMAGVIAWREGAALLGLFALIFGGIGLLLGLISAKDARKADSALAWAALALGGATLASVFALFVGILILL